MPHLKTSGCALITDLGGMEVEDPEQTSSLKHKQLVSIVLPAHIATPTSEERVTFLHPLHGTVKPVQELVPTTEREGGS